MPGGNQELGRYYVGVDVGTGSVRAALVDQRGTLLAFAEQAINKWEPQFNHHEQSSEDIWAACCIVTKVRPYLRRSLLACASLLLTAECVPCVYWRQGQCWHNFRHRPGLAGADSLAVTETNSQPK